MAISKFKEDLQKEKILSQFLDGLYANMGLPVKRISDQKMQYQGIDLTFNKNDKTIYIDEKAQLHYLNKDLPTFTFELSYKKQNAIKKGWLLNSNKHTDYYFLVTGIFLKNNSLAHFDDIANCKITSVHRKKLIAHLNQLGLSEAKLDFYDHELRKNKQFGKHYIEEIGSKHGALHFTEHLSEQPINLKLRLDYLIKMNVAKRIFPTN